jgi:ribosomal protein S18 acetylase RimI-like enzyme
MRNGQSAAPDSGGMTQANIGFALRPETASDAALVRRLFTTGRGAFFAAINLPQAALDQLIELQLEARAAHVATCYPGARAEIILVDGAPAGRIVVDRSRNPWYVADVAVLPELRGRGLARAVLADVLDAAGGAGVELHVAADNPAQRLYLRLGFEPVRVDGVDLLLRWAPPVPGAETASLPSLQSSRSCA